MRFLTILASASALLLVAPVAATAATTPCGFLNGQFDVAGKSYSGRLTWPADPMGLDGPVPERIVPIEAVFGADCKVTVTMEGRSYSARWGQKDAMVLFDVDPFGFTGKVAADGTVSGDAINDPGDLGKLVLKRKP